MEIKGNVEIQGYTRICDLANGTVFVFCNDNELMLKGYDEVGTTYYAIRLNDGAVFDIYDEEWNDRPVRQIKAVLTIE